MPDDVAGEPTSERHDGPTPNGGAYSVANFLDGERRPCPKADAVYIEILEYDESDNNVGRTWLEAAQGEQPPDAERPQ
jgi:hypothetical protein